MPRQSTKIIEAEHELGHALLSLIAAIAAAAFSVSDSLAWIGRLVAGNSLGRHAGEAIERFEIEALRRTLEDFLREYSGQPHADNAIDHAHITRQKLKALIGLRRTAGA